MEIPRASSSPPSSLLEYEKCVLTYFHMTEYNFFAVLGEIDRGFCLASSVITPPQTANRPYCAKMWFALELVVEVVHFPGGCFVTRLVVWACSDYLQYFVKNIPREF